ncbi:MAG: VanZ family protein [Lachnospiraceae bacterium]|nr:VanZ family protein [Lachnospiraceae bacterium]
MSLNTLLTQLGGFLFIAVPCAIAASVLLFALYRFIFKKNTKTWKFVPCFLFILNFILIIYLTFLSRSESYGEIDLHLFRSYREAWNTFSIRNWQLVIFNIVLFSPLGVFLPVLLKQFRKAHRTVGMGFLFSLAIELGQRITQRGLCELDDLLNNTLGVLLGYCVFYFFYTLSKKEKHKLPKVVISVLPIVLTIFVFSTIFYRYNTQTYGNLPIDYTYKTDLSDTRIKLADSVKLNIEDTNAPVFIPKDYTEQEAEIFASSLLDRMGISGNTHYSHYDDSIICYRGHHNVTVYLEDQSFEYHYVNDTVANWGDMGAQNVKTRLASYEIEIPDSAVYTHPSEGVYKWTIERSVSSIGNVSGTLTCYTTTDGEIYSIDYQFIKQSLYKDEPIISETEAYQKLVNGYFQIEHNLELETLVINGISLTYSPDTKGFYQPVWLFNCEINGENRDLVIPALKE